MRSRRLSLFSVVVFLFGTAHAGEWRTHMTSLAGKQTKIHDLEGQISHLVSEKEHTTDPAHLKEITENISKTYTELEEASEKYNEERLHVRFKHPERGDDSERKYSRYELKSISEISADNSIDSRLDRIKRKVQLVFGVHGPEKKAAHSEGVQTRLPASDDSAGKGERIKLSR